MPFNQLILPLLGGYLLITYAHCFVYWTSRHTKEQLLFASAFAGALLGIISRAIVLFASNFEWGQHAYHLLHSIADYSGIGTALLSLLLSCVLVLWINRAWPSADAGIWLYGRGAFTELENLFFASFLASVPAQNSVFRALPIELPKRLIASIPIAGRWMKQRINQQQQLQLIGTYDDDAKKVNPVPLILTMKDRKVYVGILVKLPPLTVTGTTYLSIQPLMSGHRDKDSLEVLFTSDYQRVFSGPDSVATDLPSFKVVPVADIVNAGLFDIEVYRRFQEFREPATALQLPVNNGGAKSAIVKPRFNKLRKWLGW